MKYEAILPAYIDSTMLNCFRACPQKFYNEYILGLRPPDTSVDLHAGAVFSATLESFYKEIYTNGADPSLALARAYATFKQEWGDFIIRKEGHPKTPENMWAAVEDYVRTYPPKTDSIQPYYLGDNPSFEFSFAIPLDSDEFPRHPISGDPFVYTGRFDLLGVRDGRPTIRDEKTAQRLESNWAEKWDLRSQFLGYCWALQHSAIPCNTVVIRGVIITKTSIRQVEAIKLYPQTLINLWRHQLHRDITRLATSWREGYFDYNLGDTCTAYSHCPYIPLCSSPTPENWYPSYEVRRWNPLSRHVVKTAPSGPEEMRSSATAPTSSGHASKIPAFAATISL